MLEVNSPDEARAAAEYALLNNRASLIDAYESLVPREGLTQEEESSILDVDKAKEVFPFFSKSNETRSLFGTSVYPSAVKLIEQLYQRRLDSAPEGAIITFTGGGPGSGKSSLINSLASQLASKHMMPWIILDGTMSDKNRVQHQIKLAMASQSEMEIWYLFRQFESAICGFIKRAKAIGRAVPLRRVAQKHWESWGTLLALVDEQVVDTEMISVFEMKHSVEGAPAFRSAQMDILREARFTLNLDQMVKTAYKILETMRPEIPPLIYEQLAKD